QARGAFCERGEVLVHGLGAIGSEARTAGLQVLLEGFFGLRVTTELNTDLADVVEHLVVVRQLVGAFELHQSQQKFAVPVQREPASVTLARFFQHLRRRRSSGGRRGSRAAARLRFRPRTLAYRERKADTERIATDANKVQSHDSTSEFARIQ